MRMHVGFSFKFKYLIKYLKWLLLIIGGLLAFFGVGSTKQAHAITPSSNGATCVYYNGDNPRYCSNNATYTYNGYKYYGRDNNFDTNYWFNIKSIVTDFYNQSFCSSTSHGGIFSFRVYTSQPFVTIPFSDISVSHNNGEITNCRISFDLQGYYTLAQCSIEESFSNQVFSVFMTPNYDIDYSDIGLYPNIGVSEWHIEQCDTSVTDIINNNNANTDRVINNNNQNTQNIINNNNANTEEIKDTLTDDTPPTIDNNTFGDINVGTNNAVSGLITMPLTLLNKINNSLNDTCTPYTIPFGLTGGNQTLTFPCIRPQEYLGNSIWNYIDLFICMFMLYEIGMLIISTYESITSLDDGFASLYTPRHAKPIGKHTSEVE